jgi:hypothetical protein
MARTGLNHGAGARAKPSIGRASNGWMPQRQRFSFSRFSAYGLSKLHPGATAVLVDELEARFLKCLSSRVRIENWLR